MRHVLPIAAVIAVFGTYILAEDSPKREPLRFSIPLMGLEKSCCDDAVQRALSGIPGVAAVRIDQTSDGKTAEIDADEVATPRLAAITQALDAATKGMRERGMDVKYEIDRDRFRVTDGATLVVVTKGSTEALQSTLLARVRGLDDASAESTEGALRVRLHIAPASSVRFVDLVKAAEVAGGQVTDLVLAPGLPVTANSPTRSPQPESQPPADPPSGGC